MNRSLTFIHFSYDRCKTTLQGYWTNFGFLSGFCCKRVTLTLWPYWGSDRGGTMFPVPGCFLVNVPGSRLFLR